MGGASGRRLRAISRSASCAQLARSRAIFSRSAALSRSGAASAERRHFSACMLGLGQSLGIALPRLAGLGSTRNCAIGVEPIKGDPIGPLQRREHHLCPMNGFSIPLPVQ
jgi:hypothetical protein